MTHRHQMTCTHFVELADAFALGILDELEQHACARHITRTLHQAGCREALATAQGVMSHLASSLPASAPPPYLWTSIEARLSFGSGSSNAEWL